MPRPLPPAIIAAVARKHRVKPYEIIGRYMDRRTVAARYEAIREVKRVWPNRGCTWIALYFQRDHSTILYALGTIKNHRTPFERRGMLPETMS